MHNHSREQGLPYSTFIARAVSKSPSEKKDKNTNFLVVVKML